MIMSADRTRTRDFLSAKEIEEFDAIFEKWNRNIKFCYYLGCHRDIFANICNICKEYYSMWGIQRLQRCWSCGLSYCNACIKKNNLVLDDDSMLYKIYYCLLCREYKYTGSLTSKDEYIIYLRFENNLFSLYPKDIQYVIITLYLLNKSWMLPIDVLKHVIFFYLEDYDNTEALTSKIMNRIINNFGISGEEKKMIKNIR